MNVTGLVRLKCNRSSNKYYRIQSKSVVSLILFISWHLLTCNSKRGILKMRYYYQFSFHNISRKLRLLKFNNNMKQSTSETKLYKPCTTKSRHT